MGICGSCGCGFCGVEKEGMWGVRERGEKGCEVREGDEIKGRVGGGDVGGTVVVITEGMSEAVSLGVCPGFKESDANTGRRHRACVLQCVCTNVETGCCGKKMWEVK